MTLQCLPPTETTRLLLSSTRRRGGLGELRSWMDREWHKPSTDIKASDIHRLITKGNFSRIYTTNYDRWLEIAHSEFGVKCDRIASVADMVAVRDGHRRSSSSMVISQPTSPIVLDETSYYQRLNFDYATGHQAAQRRTEQFRPLCRLQPDGLQHPASVLSTDGDVGAFAAGIRQTKVLRLHAPPKPSGRKC